MRALQAFLAITAGFLFTLALAARTAAPIASDRAFLADMGAVGTSAAVEPNPYNDIAGQIAAKEEDLATQEASLKAAQAREAKGSEIFSYALWSGGAFLLLLLLANLYMDFEILRERRAAVALPVPPRP